RERRRWLVAGLDLQVRVVDSPPVDTGAGTGLEPADPEAELSQMLAQAHRGEIAGAPGRVVLRANVNQALQESPGGQDYCVGREDLADLRFHAVDHLILDQQPLDARLAYPQIG